MSYSSNKRIISIKTLIAVLRTLSSSTIASLILFMIVFVLFSLTAERTAISSEGLSSFKDFLFVLIIVYLSLLVARSILQTAAAELINSMLYIQPGGVMRSFVRKGGPETLDLISEGIKQLKFRLHKEQYKEKMMVFVKGRGTTISLIILCAALAVTAYYSLNYENAGSNETVLVENIGKNVSFDGQTANGAKGVSMIFKGSYEDEGKRFYALDIVREDGRVVSELIEESSFKMINGTRIIPKELVNEDVKSVIGIYQKHTTNNLLLEKLPTGKNNILDSKYLPYKIKAASFYCDFAQDLNGRFFNKSPLMKNPVVNVEIIRKGKIIRSMYLGLDKGMNPISHTPYLLKLEHCERRQSATFIVKTHSDMMPFFISIFVISISLAVILFFPHRVIILKYFPQKEDEIKIDIYAFSEFGNEQLYYSMNEIIKSLGKR